MEGDEYHGWWDASEKVNVPCVRLVTLPYFWLHSVEGEEHHWFVSCIWGRFGALSKIRYSPLAFGYILWNVRSTIGLWVASEEGMVLCVRLVTLPFFWLNPVEGEEHLGFVSCIWKMYGAMRNARYLLYFWIHSVEGEEYHGLLSCIWKRHDALRKVCSLPFLLLHPVEIE